MSSIKFFAACLVLFLSISNVLAATDRYSKEYLQNKKHISVINPIVEFAVENAIKSDLKKQTGAKFNVHFTGYTTSSIKKGIFKSLELSANNPTVDNIPLSYLHLKTLTDYNYIDYTKNPVEFKSDITFGYDIILTDESINAALTDKKYQKVINNVNKLAYPMFAIKSLKTKISDNKLYLIMDYNLPIAKSSRNRTFVTASNLKVEDGKIKATNVQINKSYSNLRLDRVANLINLLNPLEFTLKLMNSKNCDGNIENVNIVDNNIKVDGKIFIKGSD